MSPLPPLRVVAPSQRELWEGLVRRHQRVVWLSLLAQGCTLEQAHDLCQETWARLWAQQRLGTLDRLELPGLALAQARFLALDARRRERRSPEVSEEAEVAGIPPSAEGRLASAQALEAVRRELGRVPARDRQVLELAQEGVPHAEIGLRLQLTPRRVRQLVWELRTRLRAQLGDDR